ncbi:hypothetical protein bsdtb5_41690 [Anaeromicropila herbilytica]|uniref:Uncharacterized protein n=1 Tax=Anaeromicropila herbilytica TaxID=2785025 RepID=A0A7R7EPY3_9FIRM|nr:hypothetical protein bsdtb5_41690 [Anaeromicropila herbilytica]
MFLRHNIYKLKNALDYENLRHLCHERKDLIIGLLFFNNYKYKLYNLYIEKLSSNTCFFEVYSFFF